MGKINIYKIDSKKIGIFISKLKEEYDENLSDNSNVVKIIGEYETSLYVSNNANKEKNCNKEKKIFGTQEFVKCLI